MQKTILPGSDCNNMADKESPKSRRRRVRRHSKNRILKAGLELVQRT